MHRNHRFAVGFLALVLAGLWVSAAWGEGKEVKPIKEWGGRVDRDRLKGAPAGDHITNAKDLAKLWKALKIKDKMPKVDFKKELVLVAMNNCGNLTMKLKLDAEGNLTINLLGTTIATFDLGYRIALIKREGIKKINGKALPKG
jgi:hypothetical protein